MRQRQETYTVRVRNEDGMLWATVDQLPGLFASGQDEDELREALIEAIGLYLSTPEFTAKAEFIDKKLVEEASETRVVVTA